MSEPMTYVPCDNANCSRWKDHEGPCNAPSPDLTQPAAERERDAVAEIIETAIKEAGGEKFSRVFSWFYADRILSLLRQPAPEVGERERLLWEYAEFHGIAPGFEEWCREVKGVVLRAERQQEQGQ